MKIGIVSLGCSKNLIDSQTAMKYLTRNGHVFTDNPAAADAIIVNTCAFINDAKEESINTILEMADYKLGRCRKLIVMGCLAQRYKSELETEIPEVDRFISIDEYSHLEDILTEMLPAEKKVDCDLVLATAPWTAYLRIADGCNNKCSFCAIPLIRGAYKSVPMEQILEEARKLKDHGVKELNLIAQDSTKYGLDLYRKLMLPELLRKLDEMDFHWIRILYLYPDEINEELLDTIANSKHILPYFDIPSQHGSDRLLRLMKRFSSKEKILSIIEDIRRRFADPTLRTTVIVGFPAESKEDFAELTDFVERARWDHLGAFKYSLEENTAAYDIHPRVSDRIASSRYDKIMRLQSSINQEKSHQYVDTVQEVLVEGRDAIKNLYVGRSRHQAPDDIDGHVVLTSDQPIRTGEFVQVRITEANGYDFKGEAVF